MPSLALVLGARDTASQPEYAEDTIPPPAISNTVVWIVAAVVCGIIVVGIAFALVLMYYTRRRQYRRDQELHPYLSRGEIIRRRKMSRIDLLREEEEFRRHMIRKSLAARSTDSGGSNFSIMMDQLDREIRQIERQESTRLKEDWKRWEARERRERSMSAGQHPAASALAASQVPILDMPTPAKHRSHGRTASMSPPPYPPVPPRHPGRISQSSTGS